MFTLQQVVQQWSNSFTEIIQQFTEVRKANVASAKLLQILDRAPKIPLDVGVSFHARPAGRIEFRHVIFRYEGRTDLALDDLSFVIEPGETVAIVGESGCGKSTVLALMQRLYEVHEGGEVLLDGVNVRQVNPLDLRSHVALVPQAPAMFSLTIKDNVRFGRSESRTR